MTAPATPRPRASGGRRGCYGTAVVSYSGPDNDPRGRTEELGTRPTRDAAALDFLVGAK